MQPEPSPVVRRDRMPAQVTLPDGRVLAEARAVLTAERLYVWTGGPHGVELAAELPYDAEASVTPQGDRVLWTVQTPEGIATVERGSGCGCGSIPATGVRSLQSDAGRELALAGHRTEPSKVEGS